MSNASDQRSGPRPHTGSSCRCCCSAGSGRSSTSCTPSWPAAGIPDLRPAHGFALQAIGARGATATEAGRRLGISKQAAGKTIERLEANSATCRRPVTTRTGAASWSASPPRGLDALAMSAMIFDDIRSRWAGALGPGRLSALEADLRTMAPGETFRLDVPGWFGAEMATVTFAGCGDAFGSGGRFQACIHVRPGPDNRRCCSTAARHR